MNRYNTKSKEKTSKSEIEYFPRGKEDFSFNNAKADSSHSSAFLSKKRSKTEGQQKTSKSKDADTLQIEKEAEGETSRVMTPHFKVGDLVLLTISEIRKDYMIANYTRNKKAMIHSSYCGIDDDDFSFVKYFKIGQFVNGAVISPGNDLKLSSGHTNKKILVSIDPKIVNTGLRSSKIVVGMDLYGQLLFDNKGQYYADFRFNEKNDDDGFNIKLDNEEEEEQEPKHEDDHDDEDIDMDFKTNNKSKLLRKSAKPIKYILIDNETEEERSIFLDKTIGSYYYFKIIKSHFNIKRKQREIILSLNQLKYKFTIKSLDFAMLRPGFYFKTNITRNLMNGIEVAFGGNIGSIFIDHIKSATKTKNIYARIIHLSTTKQITSLSTLSHIKHLQCDQIALKEEMVGNSYKAVISQEIYGKSYRINLLNENNEQVAFAFLHNNNMIPKENEGEEYKEKETIEKVIVKEYNFFDNSPICTMKTKNEFINWNTMPIGTIIPSCIIDRINNSEIIVKMNDFIEGRIPLEHLTDHPLSKIPKKFKKGMKIKTRVFACDPKTKKLLLTMKETLLDQNVTIHRNVRELTEGEDVYVVYVGKGLFEHSGNVIGKLMRFNTMKETDFKIGKLYKYKVYKVNHHSHKVYFTNDKEIWLPGIGDYDTCIKRNHILSNITTLLNTFEENEQFDEGTVHTFTTVPIDKLIKLLLKRKVDSKLIEEDKETLTCQYLFAKYSNVTKGNYYAFIPKGLLIDFFTEQLFTKLQNEESEIQLLILYHNKETKTLFATMKQSLLIHKDEIIHINPSIINLKEQQWENDKLYYGYVNKTTPKGVMVQFYGRKKILMRPQAFNSEYTQGQTVICRYFNKKFYFDINAYHMYKNEDFINESNEYFDIYKSYLKQIKSEDNTIGKAIIIDIEGTVTSLKDYGAVISLSQSLPKTKFTGLINKEHMNTSLQEGDKAKFTVIDVDYLNGIIHLKSAINANAIPLKEKLDLNEVYDITIDLISTHYICGNCKGNKVYIRSTLYDFNVLQSKTDVHLNALKIGENVETMITSYDKQLNAYIANIPLMIISKLKGKGKRKQSENIGEMITGRINGIKGNFIYVAISKNSRGKIHLSNFNGNIDHIKSLLDLQQKSKLNKSKSERKLSVDSNTSQIGTIPSDLIIKAKIVNVETEEKKNMKVFTLSSLLTDNNNDALEEEEVIEAIPKASLSNSLDLSGKKPNSGVISAIKNFSKYPITISINNSSKSVINANKIQIPFNEIPLNKISLDNDTSLGGIQFKVGQLLQFYSSINNIHSLSPITSSSLPSTTTISIEIGKVYPVRVLKIINGRGLIVDLNQKDSEAFVDICEITDVLSSNPLEYYHKGHIVKGRVLCKDDKSNRFILSLRSSIVNESDYAIIRDGSTIQFKQRFSSNVDLRNQVLKFGSNNVIDMNTLAIGYITSSTEKGTFIKLASNVIVRVSMRELTDEKTATKPYLLFKENTLALCRIVSVYKKDPLNVKYNASMRESIVKYSLSLHLKDLAMNNFYYCIVMNSYEKGYDINIAGSTFTGLLKNKNYTGKNMLKAGELIVVQLVKYDKNSHPPKLRFSNKNTGVGFDLNLVINRLGKEEIEKCEENTELYNNIIAINESAQKDKNIEEIIDMTKGDHDIDYEELIKERREHTKGLFDTKRKDSDVGNASENEEDEESAIDENLLLQEDNNIITSKEEKFALLSGVSNINLGIDNDNNAEDDIEMKDVNEEEDKQAKVKQSASKREKTHLSEELLIRQKENQQNEEINMEHFEKKILNDPNNSLNWIQYATYILDNLNLTATRKIFERAIKAIDISQSKEKLNIWVAYLNLESLYGTSDAFKSLTERALEVNEKKSIYLHLISIYKQANKYALANDMFRLVTKECFNDFDVWKRYVEFLFDAIGKEEEEIQSPKEGLNKAMQVLPKKKHLDILLWYGQLLYAHNSFEEARNTFESILKNLPKRKDIWFVYADKELKYSKNVSKVRQVYDKMLMVEFKKNALKGVLAKYLKFEQDNGTEKEFVLAQEKAKRIIGQRMDVDDEGEGEGEGEGDKDEKEEMNNK